MSLSTPSPNEYLLLTLSNTGFFRLSLHGGGGGGGVVVACNFGTIYQIEAQFGTLIKNNKSIRLMCFNWHVTS